jgi:hypothetical protein
MDDAAPPQWRQCRSILELWSFWGADFCNFARYRVIASDTTMAAWPVTCLARVAISTCPRPHFTSDRSYPGCIGSNGVKKSASDDMRYDLGGFAYGRPLWMIITVFTRRSAPPSDRGSDPGPHRAPRIASLSFCHAARTDYDPCPSSPASATPFA